MKVLIIGGGGREASLARKVSESLLVEQVFCAPGNAGTSEFATNVPIAANNITELCAFAKQERIDLAIVGPEEPLVLRIVNEFERAGLKIFGPRANAAILEGSKVFMKHLLRNYGIPTARYAVFTDSGAAIEYARTQDFPLVVKADGLAAGKGVVPCANLAEAKRVIREMLDDRKFGDAGERIIIEEFLTGEEASYMVIVDRDGYVLPLATSQDHKRVGDGDQGLNTGGMGAYSPAPVVTPEVEERILRDIIHPTVRAMIEWERPFTGFLYAGLMIDAEGNPRVLEYNVRMGDPETQPISARLKSDLVPILLAALDGTLDQYGLEWDPRPAVCVVMAAEGYPGPYAKGFPIDGIAEAEQTGARVDHAGTAFNESGELVSNGGRVLGVTALGDTFLKAQQAAYRAIRYITSHGTLFYRTDIAHRAIDRR